MTTLRYDGPYDSVDIPTPAGTITITRGGSADVPDDIADALVASGTFVAAADTTPAPARRRAGTAAPTPEGE